ncbi:hypothetical protein VC83_08524 [Pseudogymnoascus destructans]|uniref:Cytochrome P450 n=2 Tax=Pseudogymnoascus destructans TaxID=655981 RepID=L8FQU8_PSED2|nr:uncharacterized protein VC83_08524 [Pseudogymnoascus destructans]ELR02056.1 hypothetical protein GMDG_05217 [Pseudogymnoascus destructans 20631-21]OAF54933.1 hypothetical protein VC83_08524 [Pseudogymnoascus destructans]
MALQLWEVCIAAFGLGWLGLFLYRATLAPLSKLPGPWYSRFSDVILMYKEFTAHRRVYIHELHKKFGPVVRLGPNEVSFTSVEALKEIYQSGGSGYDKTEFYNLFIQYGIRTTFSTLQKRKHDQMKRYIAGSYANTSIMHFEVVDGIQERVRAFLRQCEEAEKPAIDFYVYLHCFAMDCASFHLLHPHGTKSIEGKDLHLMEEYSFGDTLRTKLLRYRLPTITRWLEEIFQQKLESKIGQYVITACEQTDSGDHSLAYKLKNSKAELQQIQVAAECMNHLSAGIDTTGDALCFLMHQLSLPGSHHIQDKLIAELSSNKDKGLDDLPYLEAVIKEGLRCFPPIPMSQPRCVPSGGRIIDEYFFPAGAIVSCQAWSVHQLNPHIFDKGDQFIPERWLDSKAAVEMNRLFFSFGAGGRSCTGRHLATVEMKCLLSELYSRYKTRIAPEMKGSMELYDQAISTRPLDQTCLLVLKSIPSLEP